MSKASSAASSAPDVGEFICFTVHALARTFNRVYKPLLDQLRLTYPQYLVLAALWKSDDQTLPQLKKRLLLDASALRLLLKRLEEMGWVACRRSPSGARVTRVHLTRTGKNLRDKARQFPACIDEATGLPPAELARLRQELVAVRGNLLGAAPGVPAGKGPQGQRRGTPLPERSRD
jgi:MarR family transcriptional regulator, organic hydroperoxide resistance regulator